MKTTLTKHVNISLTLTLIRLIIAPLVLPALFVYLLPLDVSAINVSLGVLFVLFSITDFFDGYLARRYKQVTRLGAILDPIADKFLIIATLISLLVVQKIYFFWVLLLIGREFFVTSLRALASEQGFVVPVVSLGKVKTIFQMIYMTLLIIRPYVLPYEQYAWIWWSEYILLSVTLLFSLGSAYTYYKMFTYRALASYRKTT